MPHCFKRAITSLSISRTPGESTELDTSISQEWLGSFLGRGWQTAHCFWSVSWHQPLLFGRCFSISSRTVNHHSLSLGIHHHHFTRCVNHLLQFPLHSFFFNRERVVLPTEVVLSSFDGAGKCQPFRDSRGRWAFEKPSLWVSRLGSTVSWRVETIGFGKAFARLSSWQDAAYLWEWWYRLKHYRL